MKKQTEILPPSSRRLLTHEQVQAWMDAHGYTQRMLAEHLGVHPLVVFRVVSGQSKARYGAPHKVAVWLRMKPGPNDLTTLAPKRRASR